MRRICFAVLSVALLGVCSDALSAAGPDPFPVTTQARPGDYLLRVSEGGLDWNGQTIDAARLDDYLTEMTYRLTGSRLVIELLPDTSPARRHAILARLGRSELCRQGHCATAAGEPPRSIVRAMLPKGGAIVGGMAFGPEQRLTCRWFSNFENSRFNQCRAETGAPLLKEGGASLECVEPACGRLDQKAREAADWRKVEPPWGNFTVRLIGRVSQYPHRQHYLGDGTATVLVEKLLSVEKAN